MKFNVQRHLFLFPLLILFGCWVADYVNQSFEWENGLVQIFYVFLYYTFSMYKIPATWLYRILIGIGAALILGFAYSVLWHDYNSDVFDSKVSYAIHLAMITLCILCLYHYKLSRLTKVLLGCFVVGVLSVLLFSESRISIVSVLVASFVLFFTKFKRWFNCKWVVVVLCLVSLFLCFYLYKIKEDSVHGRLTIYKVLVQGIAESPLFGTGTNGFHRTYMLQQAAYFKNNPQDTYAILADSIVYPYNECLGFAYKYGLVSTVIVLVFIFLILKRNVRVISEIENRGYLCSLLVLFLIGLFSFPTHYFTVNVWGIWVLAQLSANSRKSLLLRRYFLLATLLLVGCLVVLHINKQTDEEAWQEAQTKMITGNTEKGLRDYETLYSHFKDHPLFLYNYAAELNFVREYSKSTEVLSLCQKHLNNYDTELLAADNAMSLGYDSLALSCLKRAHYMVPAKFYPLSGMLTLYINNKDTLRADSIALIILEKEVKIPSADVSFIKRRAYKWLNK